MGMLTRFSILLEFIKYKSEKSKNFRIRLWSSLAKSVLFEKINHNKHLLKK